MRDNVVDITARLASLLEGDEAMAFDRFLLSEGIELVARFREIADPAVRDSIVQMVTALAKASGAVF